jgi:hypothetical protein
MMFYLVFNFCIHGQFSEEKKITLAQGQPGAYAEELRTRPGNE